MNRAQSHWLTGQLRAHLVHVGGVLLTLVVLAACEPSDSRPGLWLSGDDALGLPSDWRFTDQHREVFLEVQTPYFVPHSVTIWCAQVEGRLYIAARNPKTKNWPGWVEKKPEVRLKIGAMVYAAKAVKVTEETVLAPLRSAYANKYQLEPPADDKGPTMRYWAIQAR